MKAKSRAKKPGLQKVRASVLGRCVIGALLAIGVAGVCADDEKPKPAEKTEPADPPQSTEEAKPTEDAKPADETKPADEAEATDEAKSDEKAEGEEKEEVTAPTPAEMFEGGSKPYSNWIEFSAGAFMTRGKTAQAEERHQIRDGGMGSIEDLHYQASLGKEASLSLDGHALFNQEDYGLTLGVTHEKLGFVRLGYRQFRTYSNGDGGWYPPAGETGYYPLPGPDEALALDRGELTFAAGLAKEKLPKVTFQYTHRFREGQKGSTIWGQVHPYFASGAGDLSLVRGINSTVTDIDEQSDIFDLDVSHKVKKTDLGVGVRYETGALEQSRKIEQWRAEPNQVRITDKQESTYDLFRTHAYTETWLRKNLLFSSGFLFANVDSDYSGSRVYGTDYGATYNQFLSINNQFANGLGYTGLDGASDNQEYLLTLNLLAIPLKALTVVPSLRVRKEVFDAEMTAHRTSGSGAAVPVGAITDGGMLDLTERLDVTYSGVTNFVFYARGEWTQGEGDLEESGGLQPVGFPPIQRYTEDERFFQKYAAGTRWYPTRAVTVDVGGYYKINEFDYDHEVDSTPNNSNGTGGRYPAFLVMRDVETYDGNARLSWRPLRNVTLTTRYEFQLSQIRTTPDALSGLSEAESSEMTTHIVSQNISWAPWTRLYLQGGVDWVSSQTETPASAYTQAILQAQNNYWTINASAGFVVDDRTDLNVGYFYYLADNYDVGNGMVLPLGAAAEEHGVTARVTRRLSDQLRLSLKYGYFVYDDAMYGGNRDSEAHLVQAGVQYRF